MRCERAQELFSDYCEGILGDALAVAFQSHIDDCGACRGQISELRAIWSDLAVAPEVEPPADFRANVWRRIEAAETSQAVVQRRPALTWRSLFARPALAIATAVVVVLLFGGVAIPGASRSASLNPLTWILPPAGTQVMVGQSRVENAPTGAALIVGMRSTGQQPLRVRVTVVGTDATISETIAPDRYTDVRIPLTDPTNTTFRIKVDWSADGRAEHRELDIAPRR